MYYEYVDHRPQDNFPWELFAWQDPHLSLWGKLLSLPTSSLLLTLYLPGLAPFAGHYMNERVNLDEDGSLSSVSIESSIPDFSIPTGHLLPLRTKAEVDNSLQTIEAFTVEIPPKAANSVLKCVLMVVYLGID